MLINEETLNQVGAIIQQSLSEFITVIFSSGWAGREREAISLYAIGFLQKNFRENAPLYDSTQIGIEAAVPSSREWNPKGRVCKDLVLWPKPQMTCWNKDWQITNYPLVIMEWKVYQPGNKTKKAALSSDDIGWLRKYSQIYPTIGYAVSLDLLAREFRLSAANAFQGKVTNPWLTL
jgi:hypothetical protein